MPTRHSPVYAHPGQADHLRELGCPLGQGFLFSKPLRVQDGGALLGRV